MLARWRIASGDGYSVGHIAEIGEGPGFRKIRRELGVTAFGVNAIVLPAGCETGGHSTTSQQELYFVHRARSRSSSATARRTTSGPAGWPGSTPPTVRKIRNVGPEDAVYVVVGAKDGYVGRDGKLPEGEATRLARPSRDSGAQ